MKHPRVTAMVFAEAIHQDIETKRFQIREVFAAMVWPAGKVSLTLPHTLLYVGLERQGVQDGTLLIRVEIELPGTTEVGIIYNLGPVPIVGEFVSDLTGMELPMPGKYRVAIYHGREQLAWKRMFANQE